MIGQAEQMVIGVLLIEEIKPTPCPCNLKVMFVINKPRLNGSGCCIDNLFQELALLVVVGRYGRYLWFVNLVNGRVLALQLIHRHIIIKEETAGKVNDLLLRHFRNAADGMYTVGPVTVVDISINEAGCP